MDILLIDERRVSTERISFDPDSYHFYLVEVDGTREDITDNIKQSDKVRLINGFDKEKDNIRVSNERGASQNKSYDERTGTFGIMADNIGKDGPLAPVLETVDRSVKQVLSSSGVQSIIIAGVIILGIIIYAKER